MKTKAEMGERNNLEKQFLAEIVERSKRMDKLRKASVPEVGLFFVYKGKPLVEGAPWTETMSAGGFRTYTVDHPVFWNNLQRNGLVPKDIPYTEIPRGRVTLYDPERRFTLFADKCIIKNKKLVSKIMAQLSLPSNTRVESDDHYRCPGCKPRVTKKQEEMDWDV